MEKAESGDKKENGKEEVQDEADGGKAEEEQKIQEAGEGADQKQEPRKEEPPTEEEKQEAPAIAGTAELTASMDQLVGLTELLVTAVRKERER